MIVKRTTTMCGGTYIFCIIGLPVTTLSTVTVSVPTLDDFCSHSFKIHHMGLRPSHAFFQRWGIRYFQCGTPTNLTVSLTITSRLTEALLPMWLPLPWLTDHLTWSNLKGLPKWIGVSHSPPLEIKPSSALIPNVTARPTISEILSALDDFCAHDF